MRKRRPLIHWITATLVRIIKRSWDNRRYWFGLYKPKRKRPLSCRITAAFGSGYIIKVIIVIILNTKMALKSMLYTKEDSEFVIIIIPAIASASHIGELN